ncbi:MAG: methionine--tRNA ligase [Candidatus Woesearchaeota archaeon]
MQNSKRKYSETEKRLIRNKKQESYLITSALPYANGSLHIGHILEYIQTDIYSRFLKLLGKKTIYCCADDTHGTPIEINAAKNNKTPEQFILEWYKEHVEDMKAYEIHHDSYYTTNSPENKYFTELIFNRLLKKKLIYTKEIELTYCEHDQRFLPDRFVKGICPKCGAIDQYGDVCEKCGATYTPIDLIEPYCVLCKNQPVRKFSKHYFFKLSSFSEKLKKYIKNNKNLQPEIKNQILEWISNGLEDWCISRDGPYFGFKIPNEENKYFYVWLDAPIGYISSLANYFKDVNQAEQYWNSSNIIHFIGKDIIYFHLLFWPAVLMASGFKVPNNVIVHGFITINKEKMSKSRGTYITAKEFREKTNPSFLRYYYASNLTKTMTDVDIDIDNFIAKSNNELVANIANFIYRTLSFTNNNFERLGKIKNKKLIKKVYKLSQKAIHYYKNLEFREVVKIILEISDIGNKYFQDNKPWDLVKSNIIEDKEKALTIITECVNIVKVINILLKPILPVFTEKVEKQLLLENLTFNDIKNPIEDTKIGKAEIILKKIEKFEINNKKETDQKPQENNINFSKLNLKVAKILNVRYHNKADKLLVIDIDLGNEKRQLVAGIKPYYQDINVLKGKHIICVSNLEHANLRGEISQGMLLAAETSDSKIVEVLEAPNSNPGSQVYLENNKIEPNSQTIKFDDFLKVEIKVENNKVIYKGLQLQTDFEKIKTKNVINGKVR